MAIQWSASSGHFLVGIDVSLNPSSVSSSTSSVTATWSFYVKTDPTWWVHDNITLTLSGGVSGTINYKMDDNRGGSTFLVGTRTQTISTSYTGAVSTSVSVRLSGASTGGTPSVSRSVSIPVRPPGAPSPPTSASAKYVSDKQITVSWTRPSNASSPATLWKSTLIQRQALGSSSWVTVASLTGTGTSWSDTSVSANQEYSYRVAGVNGGGTSSYSTTGKVQTTPAAPANVKAVRKGNDIVVSWTDYSPADNGFEIMDGSTTLATGVRPPWTHTSPSTSATHSYRVRSTTANGLKSAWSSPSNTVQLLSPPSAPQELSPATSAVDDKLTLTWVHNPVDTSDQTAFEISYSTDGGSTWTSTGTVKSSDQSWDATSLASSGATAIQWRVRTCGAYQGTNPWSAWSYVQTTQLSHYPLATIQFPGDATITSSSMTVSWSFFQADGHPQIGWTVAVVDPTTNAPVFSRSGTGAATTVDTGPVLDNGADYLVSVRVQESSGLWSQPATQPIHVVYDEPQAPVLDLDPHLDRGYVEIIANARSDDASAPATVSLIIERQIDDGPWVTLDGAADLSTDMIDWTPTIGGVNRYRATAVSALPSTASTVLEIDSVEAGVADPTVLVSGGPSFGMSIRFTAVTQADVTPTRERVLNTFAGRSKPVETSGLRLDRTVSVSAYLVTYSTDPADATRESLEELFSLPGPHLYRDSLGRRMFVSLSPVTVPAAWAGQVSFTCTEIDPGTVAQQNTISAYTGAHLVEISPGEYVVLGGTTLETDPGQYMWSGGDVTTLGS